jgi:Tol biopolymer transport system component
MLTKTSRLIFNAGILGAAAVLMATAGSVLAQTGEMVSLRSDGVPPDSMSVESSQPAVTPDGRYVVFLGSPTNLVAGVSASNQIYLRDRVAGTVELISVNNAGNPGTSSSNAGPAVSDDGCRVVFSSYATNLVPGDTNGAQDVFVRDRCSTPPSTSAVSVDTSGAVGNRGSNEARLSGNGRFVVFNSAADLVSGTVTSNTSNILYVRDLSNGITSLLGSFVDSNGKTQPISGT